MQVGFGSRLQPFRQLVQDIGDLVHPAALLLRFWIDLAQGRPEAERAVGNGQFRRRQAPALEVTQESEPGFGGLPVAIFQGNDLFACRQSGHR